MIAQALILIVVMSLIGLIPATLAKKNGRSFLRWWIFGAVFSIFAIPAELSLRQVVLFERKRREDNMVSANDELAERLSELATLQVEGAITDADFIALKAKLIQANRKPRNLFRADGNVERGLPYAIATVAVFVALSFLSGSVHINLPSFQRSANRPSKVCGDVFGRSVYPKMEKFYRGEATVKADENIAVALSHDEATDTTECSVSYQIDFTVGDVARTKRPNYNAADDILGGIHQLQGAVQQKTIEYTVRLAADEQNYVISYPPTEPIAYAQ